MCNFRKNFIVVILVLLLFGVTSCTSEEGADSPKNNVEKVSDIEQSSDSKTDANQIDTNQTEVNQEDTNQAETVEEDIEKEEPKAEKNTVEETVKASVIVKPKDIESYEENSKEYYVELNENKPYFSEEDLVTESYEYYSPLDSLGRCGIALACVGKDIMPEKDRGKIANIKPTGWHSVKYDNVEGRYLYNRCHLIGYQLTGENARRKNLITGTRQFNVDGMLPFENQIAEYIKETDNHVMLRVIPVFSGKNLLASGVQMEAMSVEDNGEGVCFNVYVYNAQDGIKINYKTGKSKQKQSKNTSKKNEQKTSKKNNSVKVPTEEETSEKENLCWVPVNGGTKYHTHEGCSNMKEPKQVSVETAKENGYEPCKRCH